MDIRIECRFCGGAFELEAAAAARRVKCPHCNNPLAVSATGSMVKMGGRAHLSEDVSVRPVRGRDRTRRVRRAVRIAVLCTLAAAAFLVWRQHRALAGRSIDQLFADFVSQTATAHRILLRRLILERVQPLDHLLARDHVAHPDPEVRGLAAEVMGVSRQTAAHESLARLARSDPDADVRAAAAAALGKLRIFASIETLIGVLGAKEESRRVQGAAMGALRELARPYNFAGPSAWVEWWRSEKTSFRMVNPAGEPAR